MNLAEEDALEIFEKFQLGSSSEKVRFDPSSAESCFSLTKPGCDL